MKSVVYVELDVPYCALTYGFPPCQAVLEGDITKSIPWAFRDFETNRFTAVNADLNPSDSSDEGLTMVVTGNDSQLRTPVGDDTDFDNVELLMHFNGTDGSTTFTDDSKNEFLLNAVGNVQIDTAQSVFGGASCLFDGSGDYLQSVAAREEFDIFGGDFTIEFRVRPNTTSGSDFLITMGTATAERVALYLSGGQLRLHTQSSGSSGTRITGPTLSTGTWYGIALVKSGATFELFVDGVSQGTSTTGVFPTGDLSLWLGSDEDGSNFFDGWIDELRITKGVARYTSNYTLAAGEFPDFAQLAIDGSVDTHIVIDIERLAPHTTSVWDGTVFYRTVGGHGFSSSFQKKIPELVNTIGAREQFVLDMSDLDAGGDDWITSTIDAVRFDFDQGLSGEFLIRSIHVGHPASSEEATGTRKCFNTLNTCQDRANFTDEGVTLRFAKAADYLPRDIDYVASCVEAVSFTPPVVSLGKNLGQRATMSVSMSDFRWPDTGEGGDKYLSERPYDPFKQGTYWGKFRARQPFLRGQRMRVIKGLLGQTLEEMETRHYIIDSFTGPNTDGTYTLIAKDVLKLADGDRAQAPRASQGFLAAGINNSQTNATLSPAGIGDVEYPTSGIVAVGGTEICDFTRVEDTITLVRGQYNTEAVSHSAGDRIQICIQYVAENPADIIADLLENYAAVPTEFIPIVSWLEETDTFLRRLYTALLAEPTSVSKLISELVEQAALAMWWDDLQQIIRLQVLRKIPTDATLYGDEQISEGSLSLNDQPDKRISQVWTYFAQINALRDVEDTDNYRSIATTVNLENEADYGSPSIKKVFSRWIPLGGRGVALRLNDIQLGRFLTPPRKFTYKLFRYSPEEVDLGLGHNLEAWNLQDDTGARELVPAQIISLNPRVDFYEATSEEMRFVSIDTEDENFKTIIYDVDLNNVNVRDTYDQLFPAPIYGDNIRIIVDGSAHIFSESTELPAMTMGDWPELISVGGITIEVIIAGWVQGAGGDGDGDGGISGGYPGGVAFHTDVPIELNSTDGKIWGGGGGGGLGITTVPVTVHYGGGGGAGRIIGRGGATSGPDGSNGTFTNGGNGGGGGAGRGGDPGENGQNGSFTSGGAAGAAIDGASFITQTGIGDVRGPEIN